MNIKSSDRRPLSKQKEIFNQRSHLIKLFVAVGLMTVVVMNIRYVLPAPTPDIPVTGAQPETDQTIIFKAEADARVEERNPALNAGTAPDLEVIHLSSQNVESYFRFTVRGVSGAVQTARVRVYSTTKTAENGPALYATDENWTETDITWEKRPKRASRQIGNQDLIRRHSWVEYDVTALVKGDGTYTFVLVGDSGEELLFSSRESSNGPELVLTLASATPTPASDARSAGTSEAGSALTFTAAADSSVMQGSPDVNHGSSADLYVNGDSDAAQITYISFLVSGIHKSIHNVKLRLFSTKSTENGPAVHFAESSWDEVGADGITWTKQPTLLSGPMDNQESIEEGAWTEYDVTAAVTGDGTYTFALIADAPEAAAFSSREGTEAPQLVVTTGLIVPTATPVSQVLSEGMVLVGAGDIATCNRIQDELTAELLDNIPGTVFALGDNAYVNGSYSEYLSCYDSSWGRHKPRTKPVPGNHDYNTSGAAGYFQYFSNVPSYYAYDLGSWRIYALNSEIDVSASSPQVAWLVKDLAEHPSQCVLAYWHKPRWSSGIENGSEPALQTLWQILYDVGAELVITGHEHNYERFAEMDGSGVAVPDGLREIVVGTGGAGLYEFGPPLPTSQVRDDSTFGVLKLTLHDTGYDWEFVPVPNSTFTDSGSDNCH